MVLFHLPPSPLAPSPPSNVVRPLSLFPLYTPLTHLSFFVVLSIKSFYHYRSQFCLLLSASVHANFSLNRYIRLHQPPPNLLPTLKRRCHRAQPRVSWADTHSNFSHVVQVPGIYWRADPCGAGSVETLRRVTVARALLFFGYFGFADEAIKNYRGAFNSVARRVGYTSAGSASGLSSTGYVFLFSLFFL
ncbi:hypothetical protein B0H13DRAFT_1633194 [Mycena leptocephala]|nr:hypothetical protein B0H13DRAFT_1633194 [Mycena leptocephala]